MKHSKYCTFSPRTWCITHQYSNSTQSYNIKELKFCMCSCQCIVIILNNKQFRIESHMVYFERVTLHIFSFNWFHLFTLLIISTWKNPWYTPWADAYWSEWFIVSFFCLLSVIWCECETIRKKTKSLPD